LRPNYSFVITEFVITEFVITEFVITEFHWILLEKIAFIGLFPAGLRLKERNGRKNSQRIFNIIYWGHSLVQICSKLSMLQSKLPIEKKSRPSKKLSDNGTFIYLSENPIFQILFFRTLLKSSLKDSIKICDLGIRLCVLL